MPKITDAAIRAAQPGVTLWDDSLAGFGLRVGKNRKTFIVLIGAGRRQKIGVYPFISLSDARTEARRILAEKELGKVRPRHHAFEDARNAFLTECEQNNRPQTVKSYTRHLNAHYAFGRRSVGDIKPHEILKRLNALKDRPSERFHAYAIGSIFFSWCVNEHLIDSSPMATIATPKKPESRSHVLTKDQLHAVYQTARNGSAPFHRIVALCILTAQRRGELAQIRRSWLTADTLVLPSTVTKNKREHQVPLSSEAQAVIATIPDTGDYLFPASREHVRGTPSTVFNSWSKAKTVFDKECGVTGWTLHDLRRTTSTMMIEELGLSEIVVDKLLNHITPSPSLSAVSKVYNRARYLQPMRDAVEAFTAYLLSLDRS